MAEVNNYLIARSMKSKGNYDSARDYYYKAIRSGDPKGHYGLVLLAEETCSDPDTLASQYAECFGPIKTLALEGDPIAASIIGVYYAFGLGETNQDSELAHLWFLVGALGDDEVAQFNIAVNFYFGIAVHPDTTQALHWLEKSISKGYQPATDLFTEIQSKIQV